MEKILEMVKNIIEYEEYWKYEDRKENVNKETRRILFRIL